MNRIGEIRDYMEQQLLVEFGHDVMSDTDLFKAGVMDSFGYLQLMDFLETKFNVSISPSEALENVFVSLSSIDAFLAKKLDADV